MLVTDKFNDDTIFKILFWQINGPTITHTTETYGTKIYSPLSIKEVYTGYTEDLLNLAASSIIGIWVSPIPPCIISDGLIEYVEHTSGTALVTYSFSYYYKIEAGNSVIRTPVELSPISCITTDNQKTIVCDPYGVTYATIPWGMSYDKIYAILDIGTAGAYLLLDFQSSSNSLINGHGTGAQVQIPLITAPITSNAMSDYVYSGQREYDIYTAQLQAEQSRKSGIANSGTSALNGAVGGAVAGGGIGAGIGAVTGLATSLFATQVNYQLSKEYDAKTQEATDKLTSNQIASVLITGSGLSWVNYDWEIITLVRDDVSALELGYEQSELGYSTDYLNEKCSGIMASGGGIRIESLHVEGLSPEGNKYIQNLFQKGCYLDILHNA